jgi:choline dehydrogenase-like flavoprotein
MHRFSPKNIGEKSAMSSKSKPKSTPLAKTASKNDNNKPNVGHANHSRDSVVTKEKSKLPNLKVKFADGTERPDFILVGLGAGGAPCANRLAKMGYKVLCLEAGIDRLYDSVVRYPFNVEPYQGEWDYNINLIHCLFSPQRSAFEGGSGGPGEGWNLTCMWNGKMFGGSTGHYFCDAVLPTRMVTDGPLPQTFRTPGPVNNRMSLVEAGGSAWSYDNIRAVIKNFIEDFSLPIYFGGTPTSLLQGFSEDISQRGYGGPLTITQFDYRSTYASGDQANMLEAMSLAAGDMDPSLNCGSVPIVDDYNVEGNENSTSQLQFFMRLDGTEESPVRQYAASAFLNREFLNESVDGVSTGVADNIIVLSSARVLRMRKSKKHSRPGRYRASSVEVEIDGVTYKVKGSNIILAAGSGGTPRILERSGVGDPAILSQYGIKTELVSPRVGKGLSNQFGPKITVSCLKEGFATNFYAQSFMGYQGIPRTFQVVHVGAGTESIGRVVHAAFPDPDRYYFSMEGFMCHPRSTGEAHISEANSQGNLDLRFGFFTDGPDPNDPLSGIGDPDSDMQKALVHLQYLRNIVQELKAVDPSADFQCFDPPEEVFEISDENNRNIQLAQYIKGTQVAAAHEASSCAMNNDPAIGVVDGNLKVHYTDNVFVCDASMLPVQNSGNPAALLFAIGIVGANQIAEVAIGI